MNELFSFILRHSKWLVFVVYIAIGATLLFNGDPYRQHVFMTSAGRMAATVYKGAYSVTAYFDLREINDDLNRRNAELQAEAVRLQEIIDRYRVASYTDTMVPDPSVRHFDFIVANVINNSIAHPFNYLTIDKGTADGVRPELGVIDHNGVVGIISNTGAHSARVLSLLNPNFRLSCKIKSTDYFGSLVWDGDDPTEALLEELPRHTVYHPGDTIVTSGYSAVFPAGLPVGTIIDADSDKNQNFFTLRVKLFADFTTLSNVQVVVNHMADELKEITAGEENDSKKNPFGS